MILTSTDTPRRALPSSCTGALCSASTSILSLPIGPGYDFYLPGIRGTRVSGVRGYPGYEGIRGTRVSGVRGYAGCEGIRGTRVSGVRGYPGYEGINIRGTMVDIFRV